MSPPLQTDSTSVVIQTEPADYLVIEVCLPGHRPEAAGVILLEGDRLGVRMRRDWTEIAGQQDAQALEALEESFDERARELGGASFLRYLEDTLSNTLRLGERRRVPLAGFDRTLARLYRQHVHTTVQPFRTHLPVYTLRAAAGKWGEERSPSEPPSEWIESPVDLRLSENMFVSQVAGRSMEPRIPDASYCVFQTPVVGSRNGRILLIENQRQSEASGLRYTIKRYTSAKRPRPDGGWEHDWIRLEPLNPEFESWELKEGDQCSVIAEFVRVLD